MIPKHWNYKEIEKIAFTYAGGTPTRTQSSMFGGSIPWVKSSELNLRSINDTEEKLTELGCSCSSTKWVPPNTPLIAMYGATAGVVSWLRIRALTNQAVLAVVPKSQETDPRWLYWILKFYSNQLTASVQGSGQPNLNKNLIDNLRVPYSPFLEQQKIAETLDKTDLYITHTENLITKYQRIKTGLMQDLLTRGIDGNGQLRDPKTHKFKPSSLGKIPDQWSVKLLSSLAEVNSGVTLGRQIAGPETVELPYLRVANVQDGYLDLSEVKTVRVYKEEVSRFLLEPGDVLMNEGGDYDKLGRGTVWRGQISPCLHQNHVFRVRCNQDLLLPDFLAFISASSYGKKFFMLNSKQSTNLASINSTQLKSFPVPCPDISEQLKIIDVFTEITSLIQSELNNQMKLEVTKNGLMQDLLTGKVPVEPLLTN
jgi:type I restriction enzyme S subunit